MTFSLLYKISSNLLTKNKLNIISSLNYDSRLCKNCGVRLFSNLRTTTLLNTLRNLNRKNIVDLSNGRNYTTKSNGKSVKKVLVPKGKDVPVETNVRINKAQINRLFSLAKPEKWKIIAAVGLLLISSSVSMAVPFSLGKVLDIIYTSASDMVAAREKLNKVCLLLCGIFVLGGFCNFGRVYLMSIAGQRMTQNLRQKLFSSIIKQEAGWFDKVSTGQLVNRLSADTQLVGSTLSSNISDGLRSLFMVSAGAGMMFYMSSELALVGLSIVPPMAGLAIIYGRFVRKITKQLQDGLAGATEVAEEKISNIRTVKTFSKEFVEAEKYNDKIKNVLTLAYKESLAKGLFYGSTGLTGNVIIISVLYYGGVMVSGQHITVGNLTSFLLYAAYIGISIGGLSSFYSELNKGIGAASRLWDIIDRVPAVPIQGGLIPSYLPKGEISFENINFSYPTRPGKNILENFNLRLEPGKVLAVVGGSGSGKTTLALLLLRLYEADVGAVKLDGRDIKELDPMWLRSHIGTVSQEPILFSASIKENILYGLDDPSLATEEQFLEAARLARVDEFVQTLPQGYDTETGERGVALSGGQRQRIAIARAIIKNPRIIILDEATSALDPHSEYLVREALKSVSQNRTVLTIAHRLSTIQSADTIAVLQNGSIVEQGSYRELVNIKDGVFKELIRHQTFQEIEGS